MTRFTGRVAVVTGAASGIGRATAERLAGEGAAVLCLDVHDERLAGLVEALGKSGADARGRHCDVSDPAACDAAIADAVAAWGGVDVLCNVAGIAILERTLRVDDERWRKILDVNLSGTFFMSRAALPSLLERRGNIVNVSSQSGLKGIAYQAPYAASKGGVVILTRSMAVEYAKEGVRVNCVCPGAVMTNIAESFEMPGDLDPALTARMMQLEPVLSKPEEIAAAIAFLASEDASSITGVALPVDGGCVT